MVHIFVFGLHQTVSVHLAKVKADNNFNKYSISKSIIKWYNDSVHDDGQ